MSAPESPAETVRRSAEKMRGLATAAIDAGWTEPAHVTSVHEPAEPWDGEALIVGSGKDHYDAEDPSAWTSKRYIADAEDEQFAAFIAALHPSVALLIAEQWDAVAADMQHSGAHGIRTASKVTVFDRRSALRPDWTALHAAAVKFLGEETAHA